MSALSAGLPRRAGTYSNRLSPDFVARARGAVRYPCWMWKEAGKACPVVELTPPHSFGLVALVSDSAVGEKESFISRRCLAAAAAPDALAIEHVVVCISVAERLCVVASLRRRVVEVARFELKEWETRRRCALPLARAVEAIEKCHAGRGRGVVCASRIDAARAIVSRSPFRGSVKVVFVVDARWWLHNFGAV